MARRHVDEPWRGTRDRLSPAVGDEKRGDDSDAAASDAAARVSRPGLGIAAIFACSVCVLFLILYNFPELDE